MVKKGYKQTKSGVIPEDWEIFQLGSISHFHDSKRVPIKESDRLKLRGDYPYYGASGIIDYVNDYIFDGNYILLGEDGANIIDRSSRLSFVSGKCWINNHAHVIEPHDNMDIYFLSEYLESISYDEYNTGTAQPKLNREKCNAIPVPVPPLSEQVRIANFLRECDCLISTLEKEVSKEKAIKQGTMQELLTGKRRLPGFSGEWEIFVFGDLFDFIPNNAFTRAQLSDSGKVKNIHYGDILTKFGAYISANSNEIPYIGKEIDLSRFAEKCYLQSGDVIIADTAEDETVGKALEVINVECPVLAGQHTLLSRPKVNFAEKFLGYYLNATCYHDQLLPFIVGTKVSSVSKASIAQTRLVVPKYEEQQAISCVLSDMDDEITELEQKLEKYRQIKQGMMQQLLTGKIRLI